MLGLALLAFVKADPQPGYRRSHYGHGRLGYGRISGSRLHHHGGYGGKKYGYRTPYHGRHFQKHPLIKTKVPIAEPAPMPMPVEQPAPVPASVPAIVRPQVDIRSVMDPALFVQQPAEVPQSQFNVIPVTAAPPAPPAPSVEPQVIRQVPLDEPFLNDPDLVLQQPTPPAVDVVPQSLPPAFQAFPAVPV